MITSPSIRRGLVALMLFSLLPWEAMAEAKNVGEIADHLKGQASLAGEAFGIFAAVGGVIVAFMGLLKFKAHSSNPNDPSNKVSSAVTLILVGAALVAIPELLGSGVSTIFGSGASTVTGAGVPSYLDLN